MLRHTVAAWPEREAFRQYDYAERRWYSITWRTFHEQVMRWRRAFTHMGLVKGERVAMLLTNCIDAVTFDEAALCGGLVPTPLHAIDTAGSSAYILRDSNARFLVTTSRARWNAIAEAAGEEGLPDMQLVVFTNEQVEPGSVTHLGGRDIVLSSLEGWLATGEGVSDDELPPEPCADDLAGFIYTSGTTGRPKGVMITHRNIVSNVQQINKCYDFNEEDVFLSFLPFSHTFERTVAHYNSLANGGAMAFARNAAQIENDLREVRPTLMCSVPRIYEKIHQRLLHELAESSEEKRHQTAWALETGWRRFAEAQPPSDRALAPAHSSTKPSGPSSTSRSRPKSVRSSAAACAPRLRAAQASTTPSHASSARSASTSCSSMASPKPRPSSPSPA